MAAELILEQLPEQDPAGPITGSELLLIRQGTYDRKITYDNLVAGLVKSSDFRLNNNQFLVADNFAGDGDVNLIKASLLNSVIVGDDHFIINSSGNQFEFNFIRNFFFNGPNSGINAFFSCTGGDAVLKLDAEREWTFMNNRSDNALTFFDITESSNSTPNLTLKSKRVGINERDPSYTLHVTNTTSGAQNSLYLEGRNSVGVPKNVELRVQNGEFTVRQDSNSRDAFKILDDGLVHILVNDLEVFRSSTGRVNFNVQNNGSGGASHTVRCVANGGDAWTNYRVGASATNWSAGSDYSDNQKYKICNADTLGTNDKVVVHKNADKLEMSSGDIQYGGQSLLNTGVISQITSGVVGNLQRTGLNTLADQQTLVYPPSGKTLSDFLGGIVSAHTWLGRGDMDSNDTQYCYYVLDTGAGAVRVTHAANDSNDQNRYNMIVNYLFFWS